MRNWTWTLAFLSALASAGAAFGQASGNSQDASWKELSVGERVEVTFRSGGTIVGRLVATDPKVKTLDYTKEASLTLDLREESGTDGTMTVSKKEVKSVRKLHVDKRPISEILPPPKPKSVEDPKPEKPSPAPSAEPAPKPETDEERQARLKREEEEKLKAEAIDFYAKFQPPYWGPERHTMNLQKKVRGQAWSAAEAEFEKDYERLWKKGQEASSPKPEPKKD
jgi:hypothetical protein